MDLLELFWAPLSLLVAHPARIIAVAIIFLVTFLVYGLVRGYWTWQLLWATGFWTAFAVWEWLILSQEANIRVDLFLIYPVLLGVSGWSFWSLLRRRRQPR